MSDDMKYLLFYGALWVAGIGAWLWIRWRLAKDAAAEKAARDAWALVTPRDGCTRSIPGCICARDNLGEWCVHRLPSGKTPNAKFSGGPARFGKCVPGEQEGENDGAEYVECCDCGASTCLVFPLMDSAKQVLRDMWNRRTEVRHEG